MTIHKILTICIFLVCMTACRATETPVPQTFTAPPASTATALPASSPTPQSSSAANPAPPPALPPVPQWWELEPLSATLRSDPEPPEMDVVFFRADGLWHYDSALAQERQIVALPPTMAQRVPRSIAWAPNGARVAYLTYREENGGTQWADVTVVELATGATAQLMAVPIFIPGGLTWSLPGTELYAIGIFESEEETEWGLYVLSVATETVPEVLLTERRSGAGLSGPLQVTPEGYVRYLHFEPREIAIHQINPLEGTVETIAPIPGTSSFPFAVPHQTLLDDTEVLYLLSTMRTGWEAQVGLYHVTNEESRKLLFLEEGYGLEVGLGPKQWVALGAGPAESSPLIICDIPAERCQQLPEPLRAALLRLINPEGLPFSTIKFVPVSWRAEQLFFMAIVLGPDVSDLGGLFRYDTSTGEIVPLLMGLEEVVLAL